MENQLENLHKLVNSDHESETGKEDKIFEQDDSSDNDYNVIMVNIEKVNELSVCETNQRRKTKETKESKHDNKGKTTPCNSTQKCQELDDFITKIKPQLECEICKDIFPNYNALRIHFNQKHQTKCFIMCCNKKIYRRYLLVEHLRMHINPDSFKCNICGINSSSSRSLSAHTRFMHGNVKMLDCKICHKHFKTKPILIRHMEVHNDGGKEFKCSKCDRSYGSDYQLKGHVNKVHHEAQICEQCGKTVHGTRALKQHIIHQHTDIKLPKYPCDQCNAELASKKTLKSHKLSFHNDGLTAFVCKLCGKTASSERGLLCHKKYVHEMERKYKCQYCEKAFKKSSNLKDHVSTHTGEHFYQCYYCPQTFGSSTNMHTHRKKDHPVEFAMSRKEKTPLPKVNLNNVTKEVVL